ncbi:MAG: tRNA (adenosine(37)-N6)-dimethylallyltransferase MiaA [Bacteroides sp.]|nr:tRNA (adenosine(37)-N6)-dimethylallyltransferase MiaA [Bacteroides sp.]MCM1379433.1 tRNA (adenosine(37)-N6)-dimethylallyltransferase MiaA [Bacteroides sp.]MCM1445293.1 tRNA (adenosine(37)-N6)-dimethylallyltransferase MiaA [Prevotella sp.]
MMKVVVIMGATASGKSALAVDLAEEWGCEIISADSRQIYRHMPITTAVPTAEERARVPHHLVEQLELDEYYSAARFEEDSLQLIADMERRGLDRCIVCGGSMMYIDALTRGLDLLPTISDAVREGTLRFFNEHGIEAVREELQRLDPEYYARVDINNHRRLIHALEIIRESGKKVSELRTGVAKPRPFEIEKRVIELPREELFRRINARVDRMVADGMEQEARSLYPLRHLNSLNTVGFKEMFAYFDGLMDRTTAIERIKKNTRVYAKKQLTWFR